MLIRLVSTFLALVVAVPCLARQAETASKDGPEDGLMAQIDESLKDLRSTNDEKREAAEAKIVAAADQLTSGFKSYAPEKQKAVVATFGKVFQTRTSDDKNQAYIAAAAALSEMGPDAEAQLLKAMKVAHLEKRKEVQTWLVRSLGKHRDEKQIDFFIKLLIKDDSDMVKAAVESLGEYRESDAKVRKKIAEALVREYAKTHNADNAAKGNDTVWRERLIAIEVPMNTSLEMLTLQRFQTAPDWEKWFNDNRNKTW